MRVALVAAEAVPIIKVGGLGDVVGSLAVALAARGHDVTIVIPGPGAPDATRLGKRTFEFDGSTEKVGLAELRHRGVRYLSLGVAGFEQGTAYGAADEAKRFVRFAVAAATCIDADAIHAHDWQAALLPVLRHAGRVRARASIFTIHNLAFQGRVNGADLLRWSGLPERYLEVEALEFFGGANLMKGGVVFADRVTTVSQTYAREIQTAEGGAGLDGLLRKHAGKLTGIVNGIDVAIWDPRSDAHLSARYDDVAAPGKLACGEALRRELGAANPVLGLIGRMTYQKGFDLVRGALPDLLALGYDLAVLGTGDDTEEAAWRELGARHRGRVHVHASFDEPFAHRLYAGCDGLLVPSRFEPCGLVQLIAQRYGTPPIARRTGGLSDTILHGRTGFHFEAPHAEGVVAGVLRYHLAHDRQAVARAGMAKDVSWDQAASAYEHLYKEVLDA